MKKAILFDLDGTLWHTSDVILPIWNEVLKKHPETQKQITLEEMNSYMGKTIEQIANIMLPELSEENGVNIIKECCAVEVPYLEKSGGHLYDNLENVLSKGAVCICRIRFWQYRKSKIHNSYIFRAFGNIRKSICRELIIYLCFGGLIFPLAVLCLVINNGRLMCLSALFIMVYIHYYKHYGNKCNYDYSGYN